MDMEFLLSLQGLRTQLGSTVEDVMESLTYFGDPKILIVLVLVLYWCVNKRMGQLAMTSLAAGTFANQFVKNFACVYRPWILDSRIVPAEDAIPTATGYSFPSGHTTASAATFGSIALSTFKRHKVVSVICALIIVVVMFSRCFLGVHTPQDVLVGFLLAVFSVALVNVFFKWMDRCDAEHPGHKRDIAVAVSMLVLCAAFIVLLEVKPFPMDYVDGQLLVDPEEMKKDGFQSIGLFGGLVCGWLLERRFVNFSTGTEVGRTERVVRGIVGLVVTLAAYLAFDMIFKAILPYSWAKMCAYFFIVIFAVYVAPAAFKVVQRRFGGR